MQTFYFMVSMGWQEIALLVFSGWHFACRQKPNVLFVRWLIISI